jgi:DNA-binding MarR family transcriptional regulator
MVIDAPRATTIVNDLVGRGLVDRQPDAADRRRKIVVVTPEGMQLARTAQGIMDIPPAAIAELSFDDLGELDRIIGLVVRKLRSGGSRATQ